MDIKQMQCKNCNKILDTYYKKCPNCNKSLILDNIISYLKTKTDSFICVKELCDTIKARKVNKQKISVKLIDELAKKLKIKVYYKINNIKEIHGLSLYKKGCRCKICVTSNYLRSYFYIKRIKISYNEINKVINEHISNFKNRTQYCKLIIPIVENSFPKKEFIHGLVGYTKKCRCDICVLSYKIQRYRWYETKKIIPAKIVKKIINDYSEILLGCEKDDFAKQMDEILSTLQ